MRAENESPTAGTIAELDGLRGIAILAVMVHRLYPGSGAAEAGWIGVDLFFVISGFLIAGILLDTRTDPHYFRNFYARRALRIFPLYYLFVGAMLVAFPLAEGGAYLDTEYIEQAGSPAWYLLFLGNVPEGVLGLDPPYWLAPMWSLAIEEQFYLTFPWLVRAVDPRKLARILIAVILLAPVVRVVTMIAFPERERIQYLFTLCRVDAIAAGCFIAVLARSPWLAEHRARVRKTAVAVVIAAAAIAVVTGLDRTTPFGRVVGYSVVALGFAAALLAVVLARGHAVTAPLRIGGLRYLGRICFGLYLFHRPADTLTAGLVAKLGADPASVWLLPVKIGVAIAIASASWFLFERRILGLKHRFGSKRHPAGLGAGAATEGEFVLVVRGL